MVDFELLSEHDVFSKPSKIIGKYENASSFTNSYSIFNGGQLATSTHAINENILITHNFDEHSELILTDLYTGVKEVIDYSSSLYDPGTVTGDTGEEFTSIESKESTVVCIISYEDIFYFVSSETLVFYKYVDGEKKNTYYRSSHIYSIDKDGAISHIKEIPVWSLSGLRDFIKNDDGFYLLFYNQKDESNFVTSIFDDDFNKLYEIVAPFTKITEFNPGATIKCGRSPRYFLGNADEYGFVYTLSEYGDIEKLEIATGEREHVVTDIDLRSLDAISYVSGGPVYNESAYGFFIFDNTTLDIYVYTGNNSETNYGRFARELQLKNLKVDTEYYLIKLTDPYLIYGNTQYSDGDSVIDMFDKPNVKAYFSEIIHEAYTESHRKVNESFKSSSGVYSIVFYSTKYFNDITVEAVGIQGAIPEIINKVIRGPTEINMTTLEKPPVEISTADDLFNIRYNTAQNYNLVNNIELENYILPANLPDLSFEKEITLREGDFPPIRDVYDIHNDFKLEGNDFKIKNHNFKNQSVDDVGLFSEIGSWKYQNSGVSNLELVDSVLNGNSIVGSLAGIMNYGNLLNIKVSGKVEGNDEVGGLVGYINTKSVNINECSFIGTVLGDYSGGLVGSNGGSIENCFVRGTIEGTDSVGGICGGYWSSDTFIKNSYFAGSINEASETAPIAVDWGFDKKAIKNCYYDSNLISLNDFTYNTNGEKARTTTEMTYPHNKETTYVNWNFEDIWSITEGQNDRYPSFANVINLIINFSANTNFNLRKIPYNLVLGISTRVSFNFFELERWFPIVRTNMADRGDDKLNVSGTLIDSAQYSEELWNGNIHGFFEWIPERFEFEDFSLNRTGLTKLPYKKVEITQISVVQDIAGDDTEIFVEEIPSELQISDDEYKYLNITDGDKTEKIGYSLTEQRTVDGSTIYVIGEVDRGILGSDIYSFSGNNITVYKTNLLMSLTWDDSIMPVAKRTKYKYRAGIEVDTELSTTGEARTFTFYGGERLSDIDESQPFEGMNRGEMFVDARDLETEDQLMDRAKLKFEEMEFETWNLEEFKQWTWNEFKGMNTPQFSTMTLAELIKIAVGITDYTERDLVNNYSREEIEQIIQDKLDVVTADEINNWAFDVSKLVARLLTGEPGGVYEDWTEREVKDFLISMLTDEFSYSDFEDKFPFDKWENLMKSRLEININNNASIEVEYNQYGPYNYMVDFQLGDIIVVEYPDVFRAMIRIIEVKEEYTQEGKKYTLTLGKEFENIVSKIKADKDDISGRL